MAAANVNRLGIGLGVGPDGNNPATRAKLKWAKEQREQGLPTVPSTIGVWHCFVVCGTFFALSIRGWNQTVNKVPFLKAQKSGL